MPDVMTPESMVTKLDAFEAMAEDAVTQEDRDVSLCTQTHHTRNAVSSGFPSLFVLVFDLLLPGGGGGGGVCR